MGLADNQIAESGPQPRSKKRRRFALPPRWVWLFAVTGFALVMPPAIEAAHYTPLPSLERHPIDWSFVIWWAGLVLALCLLVPWVITTRRRVRDPHREADFATRLGRILAMLAAAGFLITPEDRSVDRVPLAGPDDPTVAT